MTTPDRLGWKSALSGTLLVARRETTAYFDSSIAAVHTIAFVLLGNSIFMNEFFLRGRVDMGPYFELMPYLLAFFLPALTMRLWAEERKHRTLEVLLTLPLQPTQVILGKYLAALLLYAVFLLGSGPIVAMLMSLGDPDLALIAAGYLSLFLLGALFLAFGLMLSALTTDQIVAFVSATLLGASYVLSGHPRLIVVLDGLMPSVAPGTVLAETFSVMPHYESVGRGLLTLGSGIYFAGSVTFYLALNAVLLRSRRT